MTISSSMGLGFWSNLFNNVKNIAQALALVGAGVWAVVTFLLPEDLRPDDYRPFLDVRSTVQSVRILPNHTLLTLKTNIVNPSKRFLRVLGGHYDLIGFEQSTILSSLNIDNLVGQLNEEPRRLLHSHSTSRRSTGSISVGRIIPDSWFLAPDEEYTTQYVIPVPRHIDVVQANAIVFYNYADSEAFKLKWIKNRSGQVWYKRQVKEDNQWVDFEPKTNHEHREMEDELDVYWSRVTAEIEVSTYNAMNSEVNADS